MRLLGPRPASVVGDCIILPAAAVQVAYGVCWPMDDDEGGKWWCGSIRLTTTYRPRSWRSSW
jgi:hypothetical protein